MKNKQDIETIRHASRFTFFMLRERMKEDIRFLEELVAHDVAARISPETTVTSFTEKVGKLRAEVVIASLVNNCSWDGRISKANVAWAADQDESFDEDAMGEMHAYSDKIHRAHLDQLADEMRRKSA